MSVAPQRPTVRLFVVCADAVLHQPPSGDLAGGWWVIHNAYHTVWMPPGVKKGFGAERLFVYAQLTDGLGEFALGLTVEEVDLANPRRDRLMGRSDPVSVTFDNPWDVIEETFRLVEIPFPRPGQYCFRLTEGGRVLDGGETHLRVMPGDDP